MVDNFLVLCVSSGMYDWFLCNGSVGLVGILCCLACVILVSECYLCCFVYAGLRRVEVMFVAGGALYVCWRRLLRCC